MADIIIETGMTAGLAVALQDDARAMAKAMLEVPRRAANATRTSLIRQVRARFGRKGTRGGKPFAETIPPIPAKLETDQIENAYVARVRTKAEFRKRRGVIFDLFWLFDNAPSVIASRRGKLLAVPIPNAPIPVVGSGATRKLAWPRDLRGLGWRTSIIPAGRAGNKHPIIMGGPGTKKTFKPLYVLVPAVTVRKRLDVTKTANRFGSRLGQYADDALRKAQRPIRVRTRRYS